MTEKAIPSLEKTSGPHQDWSADLHVRQRGRSRISVVICTHNRADILLRVAIRSLLSQQVVADCPFEILVVDNVSTDDTQERVTEVAAATAYPAIRYVYEPSIGLSHARNRGIAEAQGEIIAFLDDDSEAGTGWFQSLYDAYQRYPDAWAIGGKTVPACHEPRPRWFTGRMLRFLGGYDMGEIEMRLPGNTYLGGGNMSFRRQVFADFGGFRTELGRSGTKNLSHEEGELFWRMHRAGKPLYYVPAVLAFHWQPPERLSFKSLVNIRLSYGISEALVDRIHFGLWFTLTKSAKKVMLAIQALFLIPLRLLIGDIAEAYYLFLRSIFGAGYIKGLIQQSISGNPLRTAK
jgi:glucosyl-dolichyl phosphate glucuronosyltransferase